MDPVWPVILIVAVYVIALTAISFVVGRSSRTSEAFASGGRAFPALLIGFLMASEFISTTASVGTAQTAYKGGISAAWNVVSLGVGFVLFSLLLARKFSALGHNTISGALASAYGGRVRTATSLIMVCALMIVAVSVYASGGAVLAGLLKIDRVWAIILVGVFATAYVGIGGMRSVVYTNFLHAMVKLAGIAVLAVIGVSRAGGLGQLRTRLPAHMLRWDGVGWAQIMAWMIAGVGATFATQYVVQAIVTVGDPRKAQRASFYSAIALVPYGLLAAVVGMCAAVLYPGIKSIKAMPTLIVHIDPVLAGIAVAGLTGAMFGTIAALTIGASTLLLKDFYQPYFNRGGDDRKDLLFARVATLVTGVLPISLALFASDVLTVSFLAKSLRAALAVLVLMMFYAPRYGTRNGALWGIIVALVATIGWFLAGDPFGIDDAYVAVAAPLVTMTVSHVFRRDRGDSDQEPTAERAAGPAPDVPAEAAGPRGEIT